MISLLVVFIFSLGSNAVMDEMKDFHAIYISVLEIDQPSKSIKIKVFANDLSYAIYNHSQNRINLLTEPCLNNKSSIEAYFKEHLQIKINDKFLSPSLQSCEVNDASIWMNFSFKAGNTWQKVEVNADYLMELFPTQSNVVNIAYKGEKKMFRLTKDSLTKSIHF